MIPLYRPGRNIVKQKAHLVAKGFTQIYSEDYENTYTSVVRLESIWIITAILVI